MITFISTVALRFDHHKVQAETWAGAKTSRDSKFVKMSFPQDGNDPNLQDQEFHAQVGPANDVCRTAFVFLSLATHLRLLK